MGVSMESLGGMYTFFNSLLVQETRISETSRPNLYLRALMRPETGLLYRKTNVAPSIVYFVLQTVCVLPSADIFSHIGQICGKWRGCALRQLTHRYAPNLPHPRHLLGKRTSKKDKDTTSLYEKSRRLAG